MRLLLSALLMVSSLSYGEAAGAAPTSTTSSLECTIGPLDKTFGGTQWLVYSCNDGKSLAIVSAPDSAASPFYFLLSPKAGRYELHGEGTGDKRATNEAYRDLKALSDTSIAAMVRQTRQH